MREIKFRVWDNVGRKMLDTVESWQKIWWDNDSPENEYDYHSLSLYIDQRGHVLEHTDEHGVCDMNYLLQGKPKYELMQYTGLKDKNGKEIYEGDIVCVSKTNSVLYDIVWHEDLAKFCLHEKYQGRESWLSPFARVVKYEVIGNIYENPELLEVSHE